MAKTVDDIRKQIDSLDNKVHDLLMKRAELVLQIGEAKRKSNTQVVQPDREIIMLRRLLARHQGPLPKEAVVRIWRELVGAVSLLQTGLKVVVSVPDDSSGLVYWDMAKDYFSSVLPMQKASNPLSAMAMVREGDATFAVLPWPEDNEQNPWWGYLLDDSEERPMRIVARLPLGDRSQTEANPAFQGLVVARLRYEDSGADRSFIALVLRSDISRARIIDKVTSLDLKARSIYTGPHIDPQEYLHIMEIDGYIGPGDQKLNDILAALEYHEGKCICVGGYPEPPVYEDKVGKNAVASPESPVSRKSA